MTVGNRIFYQVHTIPCSNKIEYTFDLNLGKYRGSKFQNQPCYQHFLADTSKIAVDAWVQPTPS